MGERIVKGNSYIFSLNALYLGKLPLDEAEVPQSLFYLLLPIPSTMVTHSARKWVARSNYSRPSSLFWLHDKL